MTAVRGLNHVTLAVSDVDRSVSFYCDLLGLTLCKQWPGGAHLETGGFWLCLSHDPDHVRAGPHADYTHLAFDVTPGDLDPLRTRLISAGVTVWRDNRSEGDSFYFLDPDGHKLELHVGTLKSRLADMERRGI